MDHDEAMRIKAAHPERWADVAAALGCDPGLAAALDSLSEEQGLPTLSEVIADPDTYVYAPDA